MPNLQARSVAFREIRNVPETLNATFDYVRQNFRPFRRGILLYVLPFLAVAQILFQFIGAGFLTESLRNVAGGGYGYQAHLSTGNPSLDFLLSILSMVFFLIGVTLLIAFIHAFVLAGAHKESDEEGNEAGEVKLEDVRRGTRLLLRKVLGTNIGLAMIGICGIFVLSFVIGIFSIAVPFLGVLTAYALLLTIPAIIVTYSLYYPVRFIEGRGFSSSFSRAWQLIAGRWWKTCGLLVVCTMMVFSLSSLSSLPVIIMELLLKFDVISEYDLLDPASPWSLTRSALTALLGIVGQLLGAFPLLSLIFYYYSQIERQDFPGLQAEIDRIGAA